MLISSILVAMLATPAAFDPSLLSSADVARTHAHRIPAAGDASIDEFTLLADEPIDPQALDRPSLRPSLRLEPSARDALLAQPIGATVRIRGVRAGEQELLLELERFDVVAPGAEFSVGRARAASRFDPTRVALFRGAIAGEPRGRAYLAVSAHGVIGQFELGGSGGRWVLGPRDPERKGLVDTGLAMLPANGFGAPPLVDPCVVLDGGGDRAAEGVAGSAPFGAAQRRRVELALDSDFEFFSLFGDLQSANEYVVALAGAISDIYQRELDIAIALTFVRLWDDPADLFNEPNPLNPFVDWWNQNMTDVPRDTAQLLTGRRNLPYGGVAYLSALCGELGYSVSGYLNGSFVSTTGNDAGNWDLVVTAHELGHSCGTLHTHDYGLDACANGTPRRGGIMSYCHTVSGGVANVDMRFETFLRSVVKAYLVTAPCVSIDCDGNGVDDAVDLAAGTLPDLNGDGIPDGCQDCDGDGTLDPTEIALGQSADLDGDGVPDDCQPDCNGNGVPDALDIAGGASLDLYLDGVPDECEVDCDADGTSDLTQINLDMTLDVDRDRVLDGCQDCDADGVNDFDQLAGGLDLWVAGSAPSLVQFHGRSGAPTGRLGELQGNVASDMALLPDGRLAVALPATNSVLTIDAVTGAAAGTLIPTGSGGLSSPGAMLLVGDRLLVASGANNRVLEFSASSGGFVRVLVDGALSQLANPWGLALGADGALLVAAQNGSIRRYDLDSGAFLGVLVPAGGGGMSNPRGLLVLDDGSILAAAGMNGILRFDGTTGAFLGRWDQGGVVNGFWGLRQPWTLRRAADGTRVLASNGQGSTSIHSYDIQSGLFLRSFYVLSVDVFAATAFVELPPSPADCNLNLVPDGCDIAAGRSADVNGNGVPDECEALPSPDLNGDGAVDGADLGLLLSQWGPCAAPCAANLNGDGVVDGADLGLLLAQWNGVGG
jgi:hypothetical protein